MNKTKRIITGLVIVSVVLFVVYMGFVGYIIGLIKGV